MMRSAIKVINPFVCPYCGSTFALVSSYMETKRGHLDGHGCFDHPELSNGEIFEEKLICENKECKHEFEVFLAENPMNDTAVYCIDRERGDQIMKEKADKIITAQECFPFYNPLYDER